MAVLENYQQADGSVTVPEALVPYMGGVDEDRARLSTRFVVVRHGETQWNVASRIQGHTDSPLTAAGEAQAEAIAARLARERFDRLVSSDLGRALRTAQAIAARTGHAVVADARLRERNFGVGEGLTYGEIDVHYPEVFSRVRETDPDYVVPGGESRRQLYERIRDAFESLARERRRRAHRGGLPRRRARGALPPRPRHPGRRPRRRSRSPTRPTTRWCSTAARWSVEAWADTAHLAGDGALRRALSARAPAAAAAAPSRGSTRARMSW